MMFRTKIQQRDSFHGYLTTHTILTSENKSPIISATCYQNLENYLAEKSSSEVATIKSMHKAINNITDSI